jgi:hypothetical protein
MAVFDASGVSANRTIAVPDASGTLMLTNNNAAPALTAGIGSIAGTNAGGRITLSAGSQTTATVTFGGGGFATPPACVANDETTMILVQAAATATRLTLQSPSVWGASDKLTWVCIGK